MATVLTQQFEFVMRLDLMDKVLHPENLHCDQKARLTFYVPVKTTEQLVLTYALRETENICANEESSVAFKTSIVQEQLSDRSSLFVQYLEYRGIKAPVGKMSITPYNDKLNMVRSSFIPANAELVLPEDDSWFQEGENFSAKIDEFQDNPKNFRVLFWKDVMDEELSSELGEPVFQRVNSQGGIKKRHGCW